MNEMAMPEADKDGFQKGLAFCKQWCAEHQAEVGVAEIALGAGLIAWGLQTGQIQMGLHVVATKLTHSTLANGSIGKAAGSLLGAIGMTNTVGITGGVGIAAAGSAFAIPAVLLVGGAAAAFGILGSGVERAVEAVWNHFHPPGDWGDFFAGTSILLVSTALLIDGARRIVKDPRILQIASDFKDGVLQLSTKTNDVVAKSWEELQAIISELAKSPMAAATSGTSAVAGATVGSSIAAGSVTVLGSHGLGAAALSLGLVSAPVWPIIAGGAAGLAIGVAAWKGVKHYQNKDLKGSDSN